MTETDDESSSGALMSRAIARLTAGDTAGGLELLEEAARGSDAPIIRRLLGRCSIESGRVETGCEYLRQVAIAMPEDAQAWVDLGAAELRLKRFGDAIAHYTRATLVAPSRADLRIWLANACDRAGRLQEAWEHYAAAEELDPNNAELFYERGLAFRNYGDLASAARDFRRAYELDPSLTKALEAAREMPVVAHQRALDGASRSASEELVAAVSGAEREGDYAAAVRLYDELCAMNPHNAVLLNNRGWAKWQCGDLAEALNDFDVAAALQPDYVQPHINRAGLLLQLGRIQEAIAANQTAIDIDESLPVPRYNLAGVLLALGRSEEALTSIDHAIRIQATDPDFFKLRGKILKSLRRLPEALAELTRAIEMDGDDAESHYLRGNVLFELGRLRGAVLDYSAALERREFPEALLHRGMCHEALQRPTAAIADFERALEIQPQFGQAWYRLALQALDAGRAEEAKQHLGRASALGIPAADVKLSELATNEFG